MSVVVLFWTGQGLDDDDAVLSLLLVVVAPCNTLTDFEPRS